MKGKPTDTILRAMERSAGASGEPNLTSYHANALISSPNDLSEPHTLSTHEKLGDIMVAQRMLSKEQQQKVLDQQAKCELPFGECARRMGFVTSNQIQQALSPQFAYHTPAPGSQSFSSDLIAAYQPFGPYSDAMRAIASRLMPQLSHPSQKTVAITSVAPREGRSHVAANLAIAFAQFGRRTLLIDADLRHPRQHIIFGVSQHPGLSRMLCGVLSEEMVRPVSFLPNLSLITSGPTPPNVVELLSRDELASLLLHARKSFDVIIVDSPCGSQYVDIEVIAKVAGSVLVVAEKNRTRVKSLDALKKSLTAAGVKIAGIVMNAA